MVHNSSKQLTLQLHITIINQVLLVHLNDQRLQKINLTITTV